MFMIGKTWIPESGVVRVIVAFVAIALVALVFGDLSVTTLDPWQEMRRFAVGMVTPDFSKFDNLLQALLQTVAFAMLGVAGGAVLGFALTPFFHRRLVQIGCAVVRAVHEIFWALIFLQLFGLHPVTGILAIAIPFGAIFAKVYAEILEEADQGVIRALPFGSTAVSVFFFARLPDVWAHIRTYTLYRLECGLRSSAILGFIGLPTIGFYLESSFREGVYSEVSALLLLFYVLIATIKYWLRPKWVWLYLLIAPWLLTGGDTSVSWANIVRFVTEDIVPAPVRDAQGLGELLGGLGLWMWAIIRDEAFIGILITIGLTQIALVLTGLLTLLFFPLVSEKFFGPTARTVGHVVLVVVRSTPEYILAYMLLTLWGPSWLPAIIALALHNAAIIGHLVGHHTNQIRLRPDAPRGLNLYGYEILPRVYGQMTAFLFYRWEVIFRESAILGMLGIYTLGFYVDSAFQDIRMDKALFLIMIIALTNIVIDYISRKLRAYLRLQQVPQCA